jgi:hypothetical protein
MLVNQHVFGTYGYVAPTLYLRRVEGGDLFATYAKSFERIWQESYVIRGRQRASATASDGPGLPVSPSVADGLSGEPPPRRQPTTELIPLWPLVDAAFALPVTDAYVKALPAATPSLIFVTPDNWRLLPYVLTGQAPPLHPQVASVEMSSLPDAAYAGGR